MYLKVSIIMGAKTHHEHNQFNFKFIYNALLLPPPTIKLESVDIYIPNMRTYIRENKNRIKT